MSLIINPMEEERKAKRKASEERLDHAIQYICQSREGQEALVWILKACGIGQPACPNEAAAALHNLGLNILSQVKRSDINAHYILLNELF